MSHPIARATPRPLGRPRAITQEVELDLMRAFGQGFPVTDACAIAGITRTTFYQHLKVFPDFANRVHRARRQRILAKAEQFERAVQVAVECGDWRAALASLKLSLARLDIERAQRPEEENDGRDTIGVPVERIAAVIRVVRELDRGDGGVASDSATGSGGAKPVHTDHADAGAGSLPGQR